MTVDTFQPLIASISGVITPEILMGLIGAIVAGGAGYALLWGGSRKIIKAITSVIQTGKLRV